MDGRYLYYTKHTNLPGIWRVAFDTGREEPVVGDQPTGGYSRYFTVVGDGLYFLNTGDSDRASLSFYRFSTREATSILTLAKHPVSFISGMDVSPDRKRLVVTFDESGGQTDIMLVENFH